MAELWPEQVVSQWSLTSAVRDVRRVLAELGAADTIRIEAVRDRGYRLSTAGAAADEESPVGGNGLYTLDLVELCRHVEACRSA